MGIVTEQVKNKEKEMCEFCNAMAIHRKFDEEAQKKAPHLYSRCSVAIVQRVFTKGCREARGSSTDYKYRGCGYALNYCPECGRKMKGDVGR